MGGVRGSSQHLIHKTADSITLPPSIGLNLCTLTHRPSIKLSKKYKLGHKMISVVRTITYKTSHDLTFLHGYDYTHRQTDPRTAHC